MNLRSRREKALDLGGRPAAFGRHEEQHLGRPAVRVLPGVVRHPVRDVRQAREEGLVPLGLSHRRLVFVPAHRDERVRSGFALDEEPTAGGGNLKDRVRQEDAVAEATVAIPGWLPPGKVRVLRHIPAEGEVADRDAGPDIGRGQGDEEIRQGDGVLGEGSSDVDLGTFTSRPSSRLATW